MRFLSPDTRAVPVVRLSMLSASLVSLLSLSTLFANLSSVQAQDTVPDAAPPTAVTSDTDTAEAAAPEADDTDAVPPTDAPPETYG
jgi:hypothetical protein